MRENRAQLRFVRGSCIRLHLGQIRPHDLGDKFYLTVVFDSGVFAGSAAVIAGIYLEDVLKPLANVTAFLAIASGILYSLHALLEKRQP
jgi:hypothetical protein